MRSMDSMLSGEPPSQYWKDMMKERASWALSEGRYLRTCGRGGGRRGREREGGREGGADLGQGAQELEEAFLESRTSLLLLALHEVADDGFGLT
jgi:hypothetical protein